MAEEGLKAKGESELSPFTVSVLKVILSIPSGKVMCYKQVAAAAGNYRASRQVSRILHSMSDKYKLPWHRMINAEGKIALKDPVGFAVQKALLEAEGVKVDLYGRIDLALYQYKGPAD